MIGTNALAKTPLPALPAESKVAARAHSKTGRPAQSLPQISPALLRWFTWYSRGYLRRHFHSLRLSVAGPAPTAAGVPLVIYSNHASWWDPLVCLILKAEFFPNRNAYAPIDAAALARYKMFRRLGFFGVEQQTRRGAVQFLQTASAILKSPDNVLAITPQSRFADVRERPAQFEGGLGHLATRTEHALFVPFATEYVFWEERLPEILVRFGDAIEVNQRTTCRAPASAWTQMFQAKLQSTQDALATEVQRRQPADFRVLLRGGAGQGGIYDRWRQLRAALLGKPHRIEHGDL